jgi:FlaG protein
MTPDTAIRPTSLAVDRPVTIAAAAGAPAPSDRPRSPQLGPAVAAGAAAASTAAARTPGPARPENPADVPEASRLKAQLHDPTLRVTSFRDEASGRFVIEVADRASGEVVDQYPPERLLRLFAAMREAGGGCPEGGGCGLIDERA